MLVSTKRCRITGPGLFRSHHYFPTIPANPSLVLLVLAWIPTVIIATSPGGAASLVGNAYFFTWINTVFVMETFIWFVHDLRKGVHSALQVKEREYKKFQREVILKSRALEAKRLAAGSWQNEAQDDIELDVVQPTATMMAVLSSSPAHPVFALTRQPAEDNDDAPEGDEMQQHPASPNMASKDGTQRRTNVRLRGPVGLVDSDGLDDGILSDKDKSPAGSTVFFEANTSMDDDAVDPVR
jgi:hypothetical protein